MFSAGIAQQMIRRQERMSRAVSHLQKGDPFTVLFGGTCKYGSYTWSVLNGYA